METIQQLKSEGHIKPLPITTFKVDEIDKAFMTFGKGSHIGKLVIEYDDQSQHGIPV